MSADLARILYENGRWHALAGQLIQKGVIEYGKSTGVEDLNKFVHNGPYSLALFQSIGLGLELMLKAALVKIRDLDEETIKNKYGHNLVSIFNELESQGFTTDAGSALPELVGRISPPYQRQIFRYGRPDGIDLPDDMDQVFTVFDILDVEIGEMTSVS